MVPVNAAFYYVIMVLTWAIDALIVYLLLSTGFLVLKKYEFESLVFGKTKGATPGRWHQSLRTLYFRVIVPFCLILAVVNRLAQVWIPRMQPSISRVVLGTLVALIFSLLLFYVKVSNLSAYAIVEGLFAIIYCAVTLSRMGPVFTLAEAVALIASIYLMIRAFDNLKKGREESKKGLAEEKSKASTATTETPPIASTPPPDPPAPEASV
jgi:hypothetical protein